ncbi:MAG TPA: hypothetical protein DGG94_09240 [Micromonosporaceae bacterium]|nr:hypothetical protein [Micromonosporaceae bacterium]HCU49967.1 hypothetical protein [Micromonosporaceae bacterium]
MAEPQGDKEHGENDETAPNNLDETMPHQPVVDEDETAAGDETVIHDATQIQDATTVMPPAAATTPAWAGRAGVPQPPDALRDSTPYSQAEPPPSRTWWTPVLLGLLALGLVGVVVLVAWFMGRDVKPEPGQTTTTPAVAPTTPAAVPTTAAASPTAAPTAQLVQIPNNIVGMTQSEAMEALEKLGLNYRFEFAKSEQPEDTVIAARPGPGELAPAQSTVTLVISLGPAASPSPSPSPSP